MSTKLLGQLDICAREVNELLHRTVARCTVSEWAKKIECRDAVLAARYSDPAPGIPEIRGGLNVVDVVDASTRSRMVSGIRGKDTRPEMVVRRALFSAGFRYGLHRRDLPGAPEVALGGWKVAVFVHGCFWDRHKGCRYAKLPATRPEFWQT